jgi:hypothetical protein
MMVCDHFWHCVKDTPELHWLPETTAHRMVASMFDMNSNRVALPAGIAYILSEKDAPCINPNNDKPNPEELKYVPQKLLGWQTGLSLLFFHR